MEISHANDGGVVDECQFGVLLPGRWFKIPLQPIANNLNFHFSAADLNNKGLKLRLSWVKFISTKHPLPLAAKVYPVVPNYTDTKYDILAAAYLHKICEISDIGPEPSLAA